MTTIQAESTRRPENGAITTRDPMAQESTKVALVGVETRSRRILERIITSAETPRCTIVASDEADVLVVDRDGHLPEAELLALYEGARQPVIVLSETPVRGPNLTWVLKPVQARVLLQSIWKLGRQQRRHVQRRRRESLLAGSRRVRREVDFQLGTRPPVQTAALAARASRRDEEEPSCCGAFPESLYLSAQLPAVLRYDPQAHLQSVVQALIDESRKRDRAVVLRGLGRDLVAFDGGRLVATELSDLQLRRLAGEPIDRRMLVFLLLRESAIDMAALRRRAVSSESLLWKSALWSSQGRLPVGTDLDTPVSIAAWPNLTRLELFPHAVQLAALWHRQAISPRATAALLDISYRYVFTFYSTCLQLGLIREHSRPVVFQQQHERQADRGLLGKMVNYLRRRLKGA